MSPASDQVEWWLRYAFIWSVPALLCWRVLARRPAEEAWYKGLLASAVLAMISSGLGLILTITRLMAAVGSADELTGYALRSRMLGPYAWAYWLSIILLALPFFLLLFKRYRRSWWALWVCALLLLDPLGGFERLVILITTLHRDYLPSSWTPVHIDFITPSVVLLSAPVMLWAQRRQRAQVQ